MSVSPELEAMADEIAKAARRWLARMLLDDRLGHAEVFGVVAFHPLVKTARDNPVDLSDPQLHTPRGGVE